jgi:hypothetical protein
MTAAVLEIPLDTSVSVREATDRDNAGLIALTAACPMRGDLTLRIDRGPNFFALHRLEGERTYLGVVDRDGIIAGCIALSERRSFVNGVETTTGYGGDFKVHPSYRNTLIADELFRYATDKCRGMPSGTPVMITVLAGNKAMERRLDGPRGLVPFRKLATIRTHSISVLWKRRLRLVSGMTLERAKWSDLDDMAALWQRVAPLRQLAPVLDSNTMARMIASSPGLHISSYSLARARDGELLGYLAVWDQSQVKQMYVEHYSRRMSVVRRCFNAISPVIGSERMPASGEPLRHRTIYNVCVPGDRPDVLRALLVTAHNELRGAACSFFNIGLDVSDPLARAVDGLLAQPTDVNAYISAVEDPPQIESLKALPLHYEIALV